MTDTPTNPKRPQKWLPDELRRCVAEGCGDEIPYVPGTGRERYSKKLTCPQHCGSTKPPTPQRAAWRDEERVCAWAECGARFFPVRADQRFHARECSSSNRRMVRPTKPCACGCGEQVTRPPKMSNEQWGRRKFVNDEHRQTPYRGTPSPLATRGTGGAQPGAARAGNRKPPKPAPSKDRKAPKPVEEPKPAPSRDRKPAPNKVASVAAFMPDRWSLRVGGVSAGACRGCEEPARNGRHVEDGTPVCPVRGTAS